MWAEALVAARMVRRAALAHFGAECGPLRKKAFAALDTIEDCARSGRPTREQYADLEAAYRFRDSVQRIESALLNGLYFAADSALAANAAQDFPKIQILAAADVVKNG
jgi:hypothetical protein